MFVMETLFSSQGQPADKGQYPRFQVNLLSSVELSTTGAAERTPRFGSGISSVGERVQWCGARLRTSVYVPFSFYTMAWSGEHRDFIVEEYIRIGGSTAATQRAFRGENGWPQRSPDLTPCVFSSWATLNKGLRTTSPNFGSSEGGDTTGSCCHY